MKLPFAPLEVTLWHDVLSAWCYVAERRLETLLAEFGEAVRFRVRPFPVRVLEALPQEREKRRFLAAIERARREPEGHRLSLELWAGGDPPRSSLPALAALEAARLQGPDARFRLSRALQRAALEDGLNVSRTDVVLELSARVGLEMNRFSAAFGSEQTRRLVIAEHRFAQERGVRKVPAVVLGHRWLLTGLYTPDEYRRHLLECLRRHVSRRRDEPAVH